MLKMTMSFKVYLIAVSRPEITFLDLYNYIIISNSNYIPELVCDYCNYMIMNQGDPLVIKLGGLWKKIPQGLLLAEHCIWTILTFL